MPRLLFYVQHLLGIGHLVRALRIAAGLRECFEVALVCGGPVPEALVPPGLSLHQLPPVKAGPEGFADLIQADGRPFGEAERAQRRDALLALLAGIRPDVVLTEAFPFGRRPMRFELLPLLEAALTLTPRPVIAASIRDILQETRKPGRAEETCELVERFYDLVLVHGDPALVPLGETFPLAGRIETRLAYTGLVGPAAPPVAAARRGVIVSAGGGAVGVGLLRAALAARPFSSLAGEPWLLVTGPNFPQLEQAALHREAGEGVAVVRFLPELPEQLGKARVSVSQAGYNTAADLVAARCPAVLVPFTAGGETEQERRAIMLERQKLAVRLPQEALDPPRLAAAIDRAATLAMPQAPAFALGGAAETGRILAARLSAIRSA